MAGFRDCLDEHCLEAEVLLELAEKGRRAPQFEKHMAHVAACPGCRTTLRLLREVEAAKPKARVVPIWPVLRVLLPLGAAAALAIVWFSSNQSATPGIRPASVAVEATSTSQPSIPPAPSKTDERIVEKTTPAPPAYRPKLRGSTHVATRRRHRPPLQPKQPETYADASGTLEGAVLDAQVIDGEVTAPGGVIDGTVVPPP